MYIPPSISLHVYNDPPLSMIWYVLFRVNSLLSLKNIVFGRKHTATFQQDMFMFCDCVVPFCIRMLVSESEPAMCLFWILLLF